MSLTASIVVTDDMTIGVRASAAGPLVLPSGTRHDVAAIGVVRIGEDFHVQSTSVDRLLEIADAFQEAARRLRASQVALIEQVLA